MIHLLTCECGYQIDVKQQFDDIGKRILAQRGAPKCFGCRKRRMREAWLAESLFDDTPEESEAR